MKVSASRGNISRAKGDFTMRQESCRYPPHGTQKGHRIPLKEHKRIQVAKYHYMGPPHRRKAMQCKRGTISSHIKKRLVDHLHTEIRLYEKPPSRG